MRVLVIEDEPDLVASLERGLRRQGMAVDVALDGDEGLSKALVTDYDVILLDRNLPGTHGDVVCDELQRVRVRASILMLTASGAVRDRVAGLELGADDYLAKPFDFGELIARIRSLARRSEPVAPPTIVAGDLTVDTSRRRATRQGDPLDLTAKEFAVLEIIVSAAGRVVSSEELLERAWDEFADPFTNVVRVTIANLRRKLGEPAIIETVIGAGYKI